MYITDHEVAGVIQTDGRRVGRAAQSSSSPTASAAGASSAPTPSSSHLVVLGFEVLAIAYKLYFCDLVLFELYRCELVLFELYRYDALDSFRILRRILSIQCWSK